MKPWICPGCGHNQSWHRWNQWRGEHCTLCAFVLSDGRTCSREARDHTTGGGHEFKHCDCGEKVSDGAAAS